MTDLARYLMIGGFLGAGKTTAVARLARLLTDRGLRVGLICNDQSQGLVDTTLLRSKGFDVEEITGGCFCCRFASLLEAADALTREAAPDLFLAEPVGSCTDLVATVSYPLRRIYGDRFRVAPLSVLLDPKRAARILGLEEGRSFSEKVVYVYRKQLEEARIIVVNKCDAHPVELIDRLEARLGEEFPQARIVRCSAKEGDGVEAWLDALLAEDERDTALDIDYDVYAEGEALLGWCNATFQLTADGDGLIEADATLLRLADAIRTRVRAGGGSIAHLKMTLDPLDGTRLSVVSLVHDEAEPDLRESLLDRIERGELVVNLRAEAAPELLEEAVREALAALAASPEGSEPGVGVTATLDHLEQLRPARPEPTHRMEAAR